MCTLLLPVGTQYTILIRTYKFLTSLSDHRNLLVPVRWGVLVSQTLVHAYISFVEINSCNSTVKLELKISFGHHLFDCDIEILNYSFTHIKSLLNLVTDCLLFYYAAFIFIFIYLFL